MNTNTNTGEIPVVDISACISCSDLTRGGRGVEQCIDKIIQAFTDVGFVYVINHGISISQIETAKKTAKTFFDLPVSQKSKFTRKGAAEYGNDSSNNGWVKCGTESLNPDRPGDYKECFNMTTEDDMVWPDDIVQDFSLVFKSFYGACSRLSTILLQIMALGLKQDIDEFTNMHTFNEETRNATTLRCLLYPALTGVDLCAGQVRCGEHSDYGSITLLFQDDIGGLEVLRRDGQYIPATPVQDSIIINVGDLMQRWTSDKLISTKHRVLLPKDDRVKSTARQSLAFFVHPDDHCVIKCIDGSDKYPPITSLQYLRDRLNATY